MFAGPLKPSSLAKWAADAPKGTIGLVAPFPLSHRTPPTSTKLWSHDATTGDLRDSKLARATLAPLKDAIAALAAPYAIVRTPEAFSASAANRDQLRRFFGEILTAEIGAERVWAPGGLWDVRTAVKLATEIGVTCAFDPLVRAPDEPPEIYENLEAASLYFRIAGAGRAGAIRNERLEDLVALIEHYGDLPLAIAFASPERWSDARNLKKLLAG